MEIKYITLADVGSISALDSFSKDQILAFKDIDAVIVYDEQDPCWTLYYNGPSGHNGHTHTTLHSALKRFFRYCWGLYNHCDLDKLACARKDSTNNAEHVKELMEDIHKGRDRVELGVELELESETGGYKRARSIIVDILGDLLEGVVTDGSVDGGTEIRFSHPELKDWDKEKIKKALAALRKEKFNHKNGTAGMHIHMSSLSPIATRRAQVRCNENSTRIKEILYPICARPAYIRGEKQLTGRYGLGYNFARIFSRRGTLEIRVWEATTNPRVFMARLKFADYFFRFLMTDLPFTKFFSSMTKRQKQNYAFLVKTQNPHAFGMGKDAALALLNTEA